MAKQSAFPSILYSLSCRRHIPGAGTCGNLAPDSFPPAVKYELEGKLQGHARAEQGHGGAAGVVKVVNPDKDVEAGTGQHGGANGLAAGLWLMSWLLGRLIWKLFNAMFNVVQALLWETEYQVVPGSSRSYSTGATPLGKPSSPCIGKVPSYGLTWCTVLLLSAGCCRHPAPWC